MAFNLLSLFRAEPPPKAPATGEVSFADPSRLFPGGWSTPYNPSELVGQRGLQVFDKMRKDDQVKAALTFKQHSVTAAGWSIKVPEGPLATPSDALAGPRRGPERHSRDWARRHRGFATATRRVATPLTKRQRRDHE